MVVRIMTLVTYWWRREADSDRSAHAGPPASAAGGAGFWRTALLRIGVKALLVSLGSVLVVQAACAVDADLGRPQAVARKAVEAILANDPRTLNDLIAPDRRRSGRPPGLALGFPEMTMLEDCRWMHLDRFDEQAGESADQVEVTATFNTTCVAANPWSVPTRNALVIVLVSMDGRWYVYDFR
jgi:hypothetical protein